MRLYHLLLLLLLPFLFTPLGAQDATDLVRRVDAAIAEVATLSYTATMRMKGFNGAEAPVREAQVHLRRNPLDTAYHFDWEIVTSDANGVQHFIFLQGQYYYVNRALGLVVCERLGRIPRSSYIEFVRWTAVADELLYGVAPLHGDGAALQKQGAADMAGPALAFEKTAEQRLIVVDTATYLPRLVRTTMRDEALGVEQIMEMALSNVKANATLPDTVLSPQHYVNQGYTFRYAAVEKDSAAPAPGAFPAEALPALLAAPLLSGEGDTLTLESLRHDGPLLIDFWYLACGPCQKAMPPLDEWARKYADRGLKIVGINGHDFHERAYVAGKLREKGIRYANYFTDRALITDLGIRAFPTFLLLDRAGRLRFSGIGLGAYLERCLLEVLE